MRTRPEGTPDKEEVDMARDRKAVLKKNPLTVELVNGRPVALKQLRATRRRLSTRPAPIASWRSSSTGLGPIGLLVDVAMRDYQMVRDELWGLRRLANTIGMGVVAASAIAFSTAASLGGSVLDFSRVSIILLASCLTLELISVVLIGIDGSFKLVEERSRRQAGYVRRLISSGDRLPVAGRGARSAGIEPTDQSQCPWARLARELRGVGFRWPDRPRARPWSARLGRGSGVSCGHERARCRLGQRCRSNPIRR